MGPLEEAQELMLDKEECTGEVGTAPADPKGSLAIKIKGSMSMQLTTGRLKKKQVLIESALGVEGLRRWLYSNLQENREKHVMHYAPDCKGGSWLEMHGSNERIPIQLEDGKFIF